MKFLIDMPLSRRWCAGSPVKGMTLFTPSMSALIGQQMQRSCFVPGRNEAEVIARLSDLLDRLSETDVAQSILVIDRDRVRRRRLPIGPP